jgi:hypothetical protein
MSSPSPQPAQEVLDAEIVASGAGECSDDIGYISDSTPPRREASVCGPLDSVEELNRLHESAANLRGAVDNGGWLTPPRDHGDRHGVVLSPTDLCDIIVFAAEPPAPDPSIVPLTTQELGEIIVVAAEPVEAALDDPPHRSLAEMENSLQVRWYKARLRFGSSHKTYCNIVSSS